jgi:hypothetical protein
MTAFVQNKMWTDVALTAETTALRLVDVNTWYDSEDYKPRLSLIWSAENE